jgi:hypothetical protein
MHKQEVRKIVLGHKTLVEPAGRSFAEPSGPVTARHLHELREKGYTVVENVATLAECEALKNAWLATMASYKGTQFDPANRSTWTPANLPNSTRGMQDFRMLLSSIIFTIIYSYSILKLPWPKKCMFGRRVC